MAFEIGAGGGAPNPAWYNRNPSTGGGTGTSTGNTGNTGTTVPTGSANYGSYAQPVSMAQAGASSLYDSQRSMADAAFAERDAARQRAYDAIVGGYQAAYDSGAKQANNLAGKSLQEAYINRMMSERNLGQQLSALGRSGGAAETTLLNLQNSYGRERGEHERVRAETLAELRAVLEQGKASALAELENARANDAIQKMEMMMQLEQEFAAAQQSGARKSAAALANGSDAAGMTAEQAYESAMAAMSQLGGSGGGKQGYRAALQGYYNDEQNGLSETELARALAMYY